MAAEIRRREVTAAPERYVASLVLFARAARCLAALEEKKEMEKMRRLRPKRLNGPSLAFDDNAPLLGSCGGGGGGSGEVESHSSSPSPSDARVHVGDAAEWLYAATRAAAACSSSSSGTLPRAVVGSMCVVAEAGRRALARELRECRIHLAGGSVKVK